MRLTRHAEPRAWPQPGQPASRYSSARSARGRRGKVRELDRALKVLVARAEQPGVNVVDVQLVAQLCAGAGYPAWRESVERTWRQHNKRPAQRATGQQLGTSAWPRTLGREHVAVLLTPMPAGRVGIAARNSRPIADRIFSHGIPLADAPGTDAVLELLLTWTQRPAEGHTARLAPPVIKSSPEARSASVGRRHLGLTGRSRPPTASEPRPGGRIVLQYLRHYPAKVGRSLVGEGLVAVVADLRRRLAV